MTSHPRSLLFVSGERPDRYAKAVASGADLACIDLEDAVHPGRKAQARADLVAWLQAHAGRPVAVRVNSPRTVEGLRDLLLLADAGVFVDTLLVPKVEEAADVVLPHQWLGAAFGRLVALVETPLGIEQLSAIAEATHRGAPRLAALMLGGADLSTELGARFEWDSLSSARGRLLNAARAHGLQAWDVPYIDLSDPAGLAAESRRVRALGYDCKAAIHPAQVPAIHEAWKPPPAELEWARALVDAIESRGGVGAPLGAFVFRGRMVDAPVLGRARRLLAQDLSGPGP